MLLLSYMRYVAHALVQKYIFEDWQHDIFDEGWKKCGLYAKGFLPHFADVPVMLICSW